jgi:AAA15 family ATPase/GTPase
MITEITFNQFGNLSNVHLDFKKLDGKPFNTVVFIGENGSGKTRILEAITDFLNYKSFAPFSSFCYSVNGKEFRCTPYTTNLEIGFHYREDLTSHEKMTIAFGKGYKQDPDDDIRKFGFAYSGARANFTTNKISSVSALAIDTDNYEDPNDEDFTRIKQLLVDLYSQDADEWMTISKEGKSHDYEAEFKTKSRIFRFENAFNAFFENLKYKGVVTEHGEKVVLFEKYGENLSIDQLSTGEKQIVFRGATLLRNIKAINHGIVLIDEPEISMHPRWQQRIFSFYKNLFTIDGVQQVQLFIATHSEYVIKEAKDLDSDNTLFYRLDGSKAGVKATRLEVSNILPNLTISEINYSVFHVYSIEFFVLLYGRYQQLISQKFNIQTIRIKQTDNYLKAEPLYDSKTLGRPSSWQTTTYDTLPTLVRNQIDHPLTSSSAYTDEDLEVCTEFLVSVIKSYLSTSASTVNP